MKANILALITSAIILTSCTEDTNPSVIRTTYSDKAKLTDEYPYLQFGDSLVFDRYYQAEDNEMIADDEYSENLYLELPSGVTSFEYTTENLSQFKIELYPSCFCIPTMGTTFVSGTLSGTLNGDDWKLKGSVDFKLIYQYDQDSSYVSDQIEHQELSGTYKLSPTPE